MAQTALKQLTAEVINEFIDIVTAETLVKKVQCPGCKSKFSEVYGLTKHLKKHGASRASLKKLFQMRAARRKIGCANGIAAVVNPFNEFDYVMPLMGGNKKVVVCKQCSRIISKRHVKLHVTKTSSHADEQICCDGWKCHKDGHVLKNNKSASMHQYSTFEQAYELIHGCTHSDNVRCSGNDVHNITETRDHYEGAGDGTGQGISSDDPELNAATEAIIQIYNGEDTDNEADCTYMNGFREPIQAQNVKSLTRYDDTPNPARTDLEEELKHFKMRDTTQANITKLFGSCEEGCRLCSEKSGPYISDTLALYGGMEPSPAPANYDNDVVASCRPVLPAAVVNEMLEKLGDIASGLWPNLQEHVVIGDGHCMFRACALQTEHGEGYHVNLRKCVVDEVKANAIQYIPFIGTDFNAWCVGMASKDWGDDITLQAICNVLSRPVIVWKDTAANITLKIPTSMAANAELASPICLMHTEIRFAHYNALLPRIRFSQSAVVSRAGCVASETNACAIAASNAAVENSKFVGESGCTHTMNSSELFAYVRECVAQEQTEVSKQTTNATHRCNADAAAQLAGPIQYPVPRTISKPRAALGHVIEFVHSKRPFKIRHIESIQDRTNVNWLMQEDECKYILVKYVMGNNLASYKSLSRANKCKLKRTRRRTRTEHCDVNLIESAQPRESDLIGQLCVLIQPYLETVLFREAKGKGSVIKSFCTRADYETLIKACPCTKFAIELKPPNAKWIRTFLIGGNRFGQISVCASYEAIRKIVPNFISYTKRMLSSPSEHVKE